jgi:glutamyl-tRNA synthetase
MHKGSMILRFDDTNPTKEKDEYAAAIIKNFKTLGMVYSKHPTISTRYSTS